MESSTDKTINVKTAQNLIRDIQILLARLNHNENNVNYDLRYDLAALFEDYNIPELSTRLSEDGKEIICEGPKVKIT